MASSSIPWPEPFISRVPLASDQCTLIHILSASVRTLDLYIITPSFENITGDLQSKVLLRDTLNIEGITFYVGMGPRCADMLDIQGDNQEEEGNTVPKGFCFDVN
jgi:hypothetical protein